jgi:hypothetical protein
MLSEILRHFEHDIAATEAQMQDIAPDAVDYLQGTRAGLNFVHQCLMEAIDLAAERGNACIVLEDLADDLEHRAATEQVHLAEIKGIAHHRAMTASLQGYVQSLTEAASALQIAAADIYVSTT